MKNINKISTTISKTLVWVVMLLSITTVSAQTDLPDAPVDEPSAPIDGYVWVLALIGLVYVFFRLRAMVENPDKFIK
jgi:amino acid transporter